jgi:hypothetical protein
MPDLSKEYQRLHAFVGTWVGDDALPAGPWGPAGGRASTVVTARMAVDGRVVVADTVRQRGGGEERTHDVFAYDAHGGHFMLHHFEADPQSQTPESRAGEGPGHGAWDGDTLTFIHEAPAGQIRRQYTFHGRDHHAYSVSYWGAPRGWRRYLVGTYHRRTRDHPEQYRRQADAIARTYMEHGATAEQAEHDAWAIVAKLHRPPSKAHGEVHPGE